MCKKIDEQAAYIKGKMITDVAQIDAKIETKFKKRYNS